ncbi:hypothetical protein V2J09_002272 [Rumex salicifolius]
MDSPSFLVEDLLGGYTEDFSLLFADDYYTQSNPYPTSMENTSSTPMTQQGQGGFTPIAMPLGEDRQISNEETGGLGGVGTSTNSQSSKSSMMMMEMETKKKKTNHNAKERIRRLHLNASYLTLRSLLPDSHKPKEKWSAPYIIDRTVDHIPQLEVEIEKLKLNKKDILSELEKARHIKQAHEDLQQNTLSVAINEIKEGQAIIQVCHHRNKLDIFSHLLFGLESEGIQVLDASAFNPCDDRCCYHIHIQMDESSIGDNYVAELKEKYQTFSITMEYSRATWFFKDLDFIAYNFNKGTLAETWSVVRYNDYRSIEKICRSINSIELILRFIIR